MLVEPVIGELVPSKLLIKTTEKLKTLDMEDRVKLTVAEIGGATPNPTPALTRNELTETQEEPTFPDPPTRTSGLNIIVPMEVPIAVMLIAPVVARFVAKALLTAMETLE